MWYLYQKNALLEKPFENREKLNVQSPRRSTAYRHGLGYSNLASNHQNTNFKNRITKHAFSKNVDKKIRPTNQPTNQKCVSLGTRAPCIYIYILLLLLLLAAAWAVDREFIYIEMGNLVPPFPLPSSAPSPPPWRGSGGPGDSKRCPREAKPSQTHNKTNMFIKNIHFTVVLVT